MFENLEAVNLVKMMLKLELRYEQGLSELKFALLIPACSSQENLRKAIEMAND